MAAEPLAKENHAPMALPGFVHALISAGKLARQTAETVCRKAQNAGASVIAELIDSTAISAAEIAQTLSSACGAPLLDLDTVDAQRLPKDLLDAKLCLSHHIVVLDKRGNRLIVATADPSDQAAAESIKFASQMAVQWVVVEYDKLARLLRTLSTGSSKDSAGLGTRTPVDFEFDENDDAAAASVPATLDAAGADIEDAPVVRFLHTVLLNAIEMRASDIHFEPYEQRYRVRFRIDGTLHEMAAPPISIKDRLASRIKVISRLDIAEKRAPQDGRMKLKLDSGHAIDFRVSTLPTLFGEKIVLRILDAGSLRLGIEALGYDADEKTRLLAAIGRPHGMILVTGPTGSGKTVSLYTCLDLLNKPGLNIATVEDPSEINLSGINQVNVNEKAGLTFATALRAFLRQDPDILMVGEIRDLETANIAIKAAQTGHLVLSTLHTNDAQSTLTRLRNMGIAPFNIASSVILISAQRLVRRLCPQCKQAHETPRQALLEAGFADPPIDGSWKPYRPVGCKACYDGYKGRIGIYQVMPVSEAIQAIILRDGSALEIARQAQAEGVRTLRQSGLRKVMQGLTSLEEVMAATNE
ncbi:MAG: type IV-A pilus assembly ATPase PilB [Burkholderiaceae bacterium]|jgi:type IV pilus assembly protein PilB|nr:type IV-A pilus assembly ATPase PilB [Burkholderiaceae bacterium]